MRKWVVRGGALALCALGLGLAVARWAKTGVEDDSQARSLSALLDSPQTNWRTVELEGVKLAWGEKAYRARSNGSFALYPRDPRLVADVSGPQELFARRKALYKGYVRLSHASVPRRYFFQRDVEKGEIKVRVYAPVDGTLGRLWVASETFATEKDPEVRAFLARSMHTGRLVTLPELVGDQELWDRYAKSSGLQIPRDALVIATETPPQVEGPVEIWVPVEGSRHALWVAFPDGVRDEGNGRVRGVFEKMLKGDKELLPYVANEHHEYPTDAGVVAVMSPSDFRARKGTSRVHWLGLAFFAAGLAIYVHSLRKKMLMARPSPATPSSRTA